MDDLTVMMMEISCVTLRLTDCMIGRRKIRTTNGVHDWAKKKFSKKNTNNGENHQTNEPPTSDTANREKIQRSIEQSTILNPAVSENDRRLFVTASFIALKERPLQILMI